jgi:F-type H+-transporting ATPase subunit gamma
VAQRLVPIDLHRLRRLEEAPWPSPVLPAFSMPRARLFAALARQYLFVTIFRAAAESQASEHASRLAAMQRAGKNLDERQQDLLGIFRRRRQETITAELLDLVAGYEATSTPPPTVSAGSKAPAPTAGRAPSRPTGAVL